MNVHVWMHLFDLAQSCIVKLRVEIGGHHLDFVCTCHSLSCVTVVLEGCFYHGDTKLLCLEYQREILKYSFTQSSEKGSFFQTFVAK